MTTAMLMIGGDPKAMTAAKDAILEVLKAAGTEAASVAAVNCLAELARAPHHTTVQDCTFTGSPVKGKNKRAKK